jgi:hypothetical protein
MVKSNATKIEEVGGTGYPSSSSSPRFPRDSSAVGGAQIPTNIVRCTAIRPAPPTNLPRVTDAPSPNRLCALRAPRVSGVIGSRDFTATQPGARSLPTYSPSHVLIPGQNLAFRSLSDLAISVEPPATGNERRKKYGPRAPVPARIFLRRSGACRCRTHSAARPTPTIPPTAPVPTHSGIRRFLWLGL